GVEAGELLLGAEEAAEADFEVFAVDVAVEIEEVHFEDALAAGVRDRGAHADVGDAAQRFGADCGVDGVDAVGWELLVVGAEVGGGEADRAAKLVALRDGAEDRVGTTEETFGFRQPAFLHGAADEGAADDLAFDFDGGHAYFVEAELVAEAVEQF